MADPSSPPQPLPATPEVLVKVLERKPILWIGAGLSIAAGYPSAAQLLADMAREADDPLDTSRPFFAVADAFVASVGKAQLAEILQRLFRAPRAPTAAHRALARLAGAGRFHAIVTTTFDALIERALGDARVPYRLQRPEDDPPISGLGEVRILQVEGSLDAWMRIMVSGRAHEIAGQRYPFLQEQLDVLLRERPVLFVGSSLRDRRLLDWIAALSEDEMAGLKPWRALTTQGAWEDALDYRYEEGGAERAACDAIRRVPIRPLLLDSFAALPRLLGDVAAAVAPAAAAPGMRLRELTLKDFRGFKDFKLVLPDEPLAVLVGVNGAGKSSVLEAAAMLFASVVADTRMACLDENELVADVPQIRDFRAELRPGSHDIRDGAGLAVLRTHMESASAHSEWTLSAQRSTNIAPHIVDSIRYSITPAAKTDSVPVLCYYPAGRTLTQEARKKPLLPYRLPQLYAYEQAFDRNLGPFQDFVWWFRLHEDLENAATARGEPAEVALLDAVRDAVERFMSALPGGRFANLRAARAAADRAFSAPERTTLVIDKAGEPLALEQLSEGERALLLLVADLARRLAIANPGRADPLSGSGIVLIDEIDLRLHPSWQRAVLPGLRRVFPGLQIIAATHSAPVLSMIPAQSVILLDGFQVAGASPPTYGRDANGILEEVMNVPARPREVADQIKAVGRLIDEERLDEARAELDRLASWLGGSDAEVVRLGTMIAFLTD